MRPFALSMGDPAGIGPEITVKAWQALRGTPEFAFAVIAPPEVFADVPHRVVSNMSEACAMFSEVLPIIAIEGSAGILGQPSAANAPSVISSIEMAVSACLSGHADGCLLYTSPSPRDKRQSRMPSSA